ncbi:maleylpyruvate isomerase family mycothiol-dependent enzyme [Actinomadura barringtoniae]|uniref:Maleylpyruvate isomerase family mycothiol-dependent enzyme n=1 Tax=Actinomadura barringtoniae TaxID=1427535 RepID=A0A939PKR6_9ACTN|nr:maleylpyruvate isomerase family mycothiol-dependent enzyme [Actinomadura barringtoniae]MBO2454112.1 maleylpyruvate isomerase family mycothiol-dependent enzyme [Actinomadura barringtoniae]
MDDTELRAALAAERTELAELLGALPDADWDTPSLCQGWRVREVVAHSTMAFRARLPHFLIEMVKARGSMNRMLDRTARRDAAVMTPAQLTAALRDNAHHPWKPPGGGYEGALTHEIVHGLDSTIALGIDRQIPADRLLPVLNGMASPRGLKFFHVDLAGVQLRATDMDWRFGTGAPLMGTGADLLMVLGGRRLPAGRLRGDHSARFAAA